MWLFGNSGRQSTTTASQEIRIVNGGINRIVIVISARSLATAKIAGILQSNKE